MREQSWEEEVTRDLGLDVDRPREVFADGAPLDVLASVEQPVVLHDGMVVIWGNGAAHDLVDKPVPKAWPGGLVEVASAPVVVEGRARVLCVLSAPPRALGVDLELLNRTELMALATGGLAHDLGGPLSAMTAHLAAVARGLLEIETARPRSAETDAALEQCRAAVLALDEVSEYMARLVRDFGRQVYSTGAAGPAHTRRVANQALRLMRGLLTDRATVELVGSDDPAAAISPEALSRILVNLISNAADAFAPQGRPHMNRIVVSIAVTPAGVLVDVTDNAGGVPTEVLPRLFEPFSSSARAGHSGVGIGLAVARALGEHVA